MDVDHVFRHRRPARLHSMVTSSCPSFSRCRGTTYSRRNSRLLTRRAGISESNASWVISSCLKPTTLAPMVLTSFATSAAHYRAYSDVMQSVRRRRPSSLRMLATAHLAALGLQRRLVQPAAVTI